MTSSDTGAGNPTRPAQSLPATDSSRLTSLDGLRGLAALIVVFHHLSLTLPAMANVFLGTGDVHPVVGSVWWWFTSTPAQLLVAGPEAVLVFFVLSGLVLTRPVAARPTFDWVAYFPQRLARLYLPTLASIVLAAVWILVSRQNPNTASSLWVAHSSFAELSWNQLVSSGDLLFGDVSYNNPLWTLKWELLFSLLLPVVVFLAIATRRWWWITVLAAWAAVVVGLFTDEEALTYLPAFVVGSVLALKVDVVRDWIAVRPRSRVPHIVGSAVLVVSLCMLNLHWIVWATLPGASVLVTASRSLEFLGALGLVVVACFWGPAVRVLRTRFMQWLGRISFSLYLVHVPIIIAVSSVVGAHPLVVIPLSLALSIGVAVLFSRFVEVRAHTLSRVLGRGASQSFRAWHNRSTAQFD